MSKLEGEALLKMRAYELVSRFGKKNPIFSSGNKSATLDAEQVAILIAYMILYREQELKGP